MSSHQPKNQFDNLEKIWFRPVQNPIIIWVADEDAGGESDKISNIKKIEIFNPTPVESESENKNNTSNFDVLFLFSLFDDQRRIWHRGAKSGWLGWMAVSMG